MWTGEESLEPVRSSWNQLEAVGTGKDCLEPVRTSWNQLEPVRTSWKQLDQVRTGVKAQDVSRCLTLGSWCSTGCKFQSTRSETRQTGSVDFDSKGFGAVTVSHG